MQTKVCEVCGKTYQVLNRNYDIQRFCSNKCKSTLKRREQNIKLRNTTINCCVCGKKVDYARIGQKYCSDKCKRKAYLSKHPYVATNTTHDYGNGKCVWCGKEFKKNSAIHKYCSRECGQYARTNKYKKSRDAHKMVIYENVKEKVTYLIERGREKGDDFLGKTIDYWEINSGKNIPESIRKTVLERDNEECYICGDKQIELQIHHIIKRRLGGSNDIDNLITLCPSCHRHIETGDIDHAINKCYQKTIKTGKEDKINYYQVKTFLRNIFEDIADGKIDDLSHVKVEIDKLLDAM